MTSSLSRLVCFRCGITVSESARRHALGIRRVASDPCAAGHDFVPVPMALDDDGRVPHPVARPPEDDGERRSTWPLERGGSRLEALWMAAMLAGMAAAVLC